MVTLILQTFHMHRITGVQLWLVDNFDFVARLEVKIIEVFTRLRIGHKPQYYWYFTPAIRGKRNGHHSRRSDELIHD